MNARIMVGERPIDNTTDYLDSRDIMARIEYLEEQREEGIEVTKPGAAPWEKETMIEPYLDEDDQRELDMLRDLARDGNDTAEDWPYGATLIHERAFEDYARDFASDIGAISDDAEWPSNCIDWERAADQLKMDYSAIDFDGETYYVR